MSIRMLIQYSDGIDFIKMNEVKNDEDVILDSDDTESDHDSDDELKNEKKNMRFEPINAIIS